LYHEPLSVLYQEVLLTLECPLSRGP
jgi:hypothetical protein